MKKLTIENWKELQPYIALADYREYNSNAMTLLMWSNRYEAYFETPVRRKLSVTGKEESKIVRCVQWL